MRSIGQFLQEKRREKAVTFDWLSKKTKIKESFIKDIESEKWERLPEFPVVMGFVKSLAKALDVDEGQAAAFLRRDYPPKNTPISPKPDVQKRFTWTPRITFILGIALIIFAILGYLAVQYINFVKPPELVIQRPEEGAVITQTLYEVQGRTDEEATLFVNNQPVTVEADGSFSSEIEITESTSSIEFKALSRNQKETKKIINVKVDL